MHVPKCYHSHESDLGQTNNVHQAMALKIRLRVCAVRGWTLMVTIKESRKFSRKIRGFHILAWNLACVASFSYSRPMCSTKSNLVNQNWVIKGLVNRTNDWSPLLVVQMHLTINFKRAVQRGLGSGIRGLFRPDRNPYSCRLRAVTWWTVGRSSGMTDV